MNYIKFHINDVIKIKSRRNITQANIYNKVVKQIKKNFFTPLKDLQQFPIEASLTPFDYVNLHSSMLLRKKALILNGQIPI